MRRAIRLTLCLLYFGLVSIPAWNGALENSIPQENTPSQLAVPSSPVAATLISEESTILPGRPFWMAIQLKIDPHWHAYWKNPGDAGMPPAVTWQLPDGFAIGTIQWPTPKRFDISTMVGFGYEEELTLLAQIIPPAEHPNGADIDRAIWMFGSRDDFGQ